MMGHLATMDPGSMFRSNRERNTATHLMVLLQNYAAVAGWTEVL